MRTLRPQSFLILAFIAAVALLCVIGYMAAKKERAVDLDPIDRISNHAASQTEEQTNTPPKQQETVKSTDSGAVAEQPSGIAAPISNALARVTKKHFGTRVSPGNSPVSPEKFSGYHTGVDFEILAGEDRTDVQVSALCSGKVLQRRTATGYGGILVTSCAIDNQDVTVVYGHLRLSSIAAKVGATVDAGQVLGVLGTAGTETDGERKHLHLGIHKGTAVNIRGYVATSGELKEWMDAEELLKR